MISGSHASTLDRLYAWERKLYDEVKASGMIRREYDMKCKVLQHLESKGEKTYKIDKTRAVVKDLHSRIRVAILRIDSISKRIEELRDKELQPQLEELIEGLIRMWEVMFECHKLQFQIMSAAYNNSHARMVTHSELRRQIISYLEGELHYLSSSFSKWIGAQKSYLEAINGWLYKCVSLKQKTGKKRRPQRPLLSYGPPPIYVTCEIWLEKLGELPIQDVLDSLKSLAGETARFLPRQEKNQGKGAKNPHIKSWNAHIRSESSDNLLRDDPSVLGCPSWGPSESRSLSLKVDAQPQQCHRTKTLSFQFQELDSSSTHSGQSSTKLGSSQSGQMSVEHSSTDSTHGIRSFMGNQDFTFPPPLLDHSQTLAHIAGHYADPGYSNLMASSYGSQFKPVETAPIRIPLQLDITEEPIYVNSKQYHAILRRRQNRAKLEVKNKPIKDRKPYLHESRHLHALKRARGAGGRFLNTKKLQQSTRTRGNTAESSMHQMENYRDGDDNATYASNSDARNMQNHTSDKGGGTTQQHPLFVYM